MIVASIRPIEAMPMAQEISSVLWLSAGKR
jgi:hypothetical protein